MLRAVLVIAGLVEAVALMLVISPVPVPYRLAAFAPAPIFTIVIGAASFVDAERGRAPRRLLLADEEIERDRGRLRSREVRRRCGYSGLALMTGAEDSGHTARVRARLTIVDDHAGFRSGIRTVLHGNGMDVDGEAPIGAQMLLAVTPPAWDLRSRLTHSAVVLLPQDELSGRWLTRVAG